MISTAIISTTFATWLAVASAAGLLSLTGTLVDRFRRLRALHSLHKS